MSVPHTQPESIKKKLASVASPKEAPTVSFQNQAENLVYSDLPQGIDNIAPQINYISYKDFKEAVEDMTVLGGYMDTYEKAHLALYYAVKNDRLWVVENILNTNKKNKEELHSLTVNTKWEKIGQSMCQVALEWKAWNTLDYLLRKSPDLEHETAGMKTLLSEVVVSQNIWLVKKLLDQGANHNYVNAAGNHILCELSTNTLTQDRRTANYEIVQMFLDKGVDYSVLFNEKNNFFKLLLKKGLSNIPPLLLKYIKDEKYFDIFLQNIEEVKKIEQNSKSFISQNEEGLENIKALVLAKKEKLLLEEKVKPFSTTILSTSFKI